jgi:Mg2+-importing ATPase
MTGLTSQEARARLTRYGPNSTTLEKRRPAFLIFLETFKSPLVVLLLASSIIAAYFGEIDSFVIIVTIVLLSSILDFVNTYKSDKAAEKLKDHIRITATVYRDGLREEIRVEQLVPGDIVFLSAGDVVPADGKVAEGKHFFINESALTGESFPIAKDVGMPMYMGSSVISGEATMEVVTTGKDTQFSHVVAALSTRPTITEFDREIKSFSYLVLRITIVLLVAIFAVNVLFHRDLLTSLLFAVALAVSITPELLPMIITMNLTRGSLIMAKHGVIVKRLSSMQNFGSMDILCTDKTGTLTEDEIALVQYVDAHGHACENTLKHAYLNSVFTTSFRNPLDEAVKKFRHLKVKEYKKIDEIPFDFQRKRESVVVENKDERLLITKGAPEEVFAICRMGTVEWKAAERTYTNLSKEGFRVLAIATKEMPERAGYLPKDEHNLSFMGFIAFLDPPKPTVAKTLEHMREYGVQVKIVTGDNELVTQRIAQDINLHIDGVLLGRQVAKMTDAELAKKAPHTTIFARVNPEQKLRIIQTFQKLGHVVGYMGDGINDAPSLKAADVGISVNNAVDIAKESADLILMHKSLDDLIKAVVEGRKTFANTLKYLMMVLSSNFGNAYSMSVASLVIPFLPLLPTQILLNNLIYDASQLSLPSDSVDDEDLKRPQRFEIKKVKRFMLIFGPVSSIFDFITFSILLLVFRFNEASFQTGWFIESLATQVLVVYIIRTKRLPFIESRPSWQLVVGTLSMLAVGWAVALSSWGARFFKFGSINLAAVIAIVIITAIYLVLVQIIKQWFYRAYQRKEEASWQARAKLVG